MIANAEGFGERTARPSRRRPRNSSRPEKLICFASRKVDQRVEVAKQAGLVLDLGTENIDPVAVEVRNRRAAIRRWGLNHGGPDRPRHTKS
jgi:hypothetical protein